MREKLRPRSILGFLAFVALVFAIPLQAQTWGQYGVRVIQLPNSFNLLGWNHVNNVGQVAGYTFTTVAQAAVFDETGGVAVLSVPGTTHSYGRGINNSGDVTGNLWGLEGDRAFLESGSPAQLLGAPAGNSYGLDVNDAGQVAGASGNRAVLFSDGAVQHLGVLSGGTYSQATAINESGQVAGISDSDYGNRAFRYDEEGGMQDLGTLGGDWSQGYSINAAGSVVGYSRIAGSSAYHAFLHSSDTNTMYDLGTLGGAYSQAFSVDDSGRVIGAAQDAAGIFRAALWESSGSGYSAYSLEGIVNDGEMNSGWVINSAHGMSDNGRYITARASNGSFNGYVLLEENLMPATVTPEPVSMLLLGSGLAGIGGMRLRRRRKETSPV